MVYHNSGERGATLEQKSTVIVLNWTEGIHRFCNPSPIAFVTRYLNILILFSFLFRELHDIPLRLLREYVQSE